MPMQATTTTPLFSAALKPDRSSRVTGGWLALGIAAVLASPFALVVADALVPIATAFAGGAAAMSVMTAQQSRRRKQSEQITLWADQLEIVISDGTGEKVLHRFEPRTVRLLLERDEQERTTALRLRSGTIVLQIGQCLSPADRSSFAQAFGTALRQARRQD